ncbi:MAG: hypothetical protein CEE38_22985 [Planctomycetes bacterium B3_Pla]|nr:MAG: hypothetical protein CEE38_22985 [Planctomycetes bacterium B3_Pla]
MSKMFFQLTSLILFAAGAAMLAIISGCADPAASRAVQIEAVREVFPSATDISRISTIRDVPAAGRPGNPIVSEIRDSSGLLGYCVESEVVGRSGPFRIRVLFDKQLGIERVAVVSYPWSHGRDVRKSAFTKQFEGKGPDDAIRIGKDIDAMSGATISSTAMAKGIREAVELLTLVNAPS